MALVFDNRVFFHIPKTGGQYVRSIIEDVAKKTEKVGCYHAGPLDVYEETKGLESFCVVRHPLDWYRSNYKYYFKRTWWIREKTSADTNMATYFLHRRSTFESYIQKILEMYEHGVATAIFSRYVPFVNHILRAESLTQELPILLKSWGYHGNMVKNKINVTSELADKTIEQKETKLSGRTTELILQLENGIIKYLNY